MIIRIILIAVLMAMAPSGVFAGMIDDFEGGVDWGASPWNAQAPMYNKNDAESVVTSCMNPEWKQYQGDFNGGPDYGYIEHDTTIGAKGTSKSLKYTVTGGNKKAVPPAETYGTGIAGGFYFSQLPTAGATITINGTVLTFQAGARTGSGQIQIGANLSECITNTAAAINTDTNAWASARYVSYYVVEVAPYSTVASRSGSGITWYADVMPPSATKETYSNHPEMIASEPGAGDFYLYFCSPAGNLTTGCHYRYPVPSSIRPSGSDRLTIWILSPYFGHTSSENPSENLDIGTYVVSPEMAAGGCPGGDHYYHQLDLVKSPYWSKVVLNNNADHSVSAGAFVYTPDDKPFVVGENCGGTNYKFHYMENLQHFYIEGVHTHLTPLPWNLWVDEVEIWHESRVENTEYIAGRIATYLGNNQFCITWTGRWANTAGTGKIITSGSDTYNVYWSTSPLNENNFSSGNFAGVFGRLANNKQAKAVFTIPDFNTTQTYYFALSPINEPTTAAFIDYEGTDSQPIPVVLSSITISGPASLNESASTSYAATAHMSDGSSKTVTGSTTWTEDSAYASFVGEVLTATAVTSNQTVNVGASYTEGGITKTATKVVTIIDSTPPVIPASLAISGPSSITEQGSGTYTTVVTMNDGSTKNATTGTTWTENSAYASFSANVLTTIPVPSDQVVTITASYTEYGTTVTTTKAVTIANIPEVTPTGPGAWVFGSGNGEVNAQPDGTGMLKGQ